MAAYGKLKRGFTSGATHYTRTTRHPSHSRGNRVHPPIVGVCGVDIDREFELYLGFWGASAGVQLEVL